MECSGNVQNECSELRRDPCLLGLQFGVAAWALVPHSHYESRRRATPQAQKVQIRDPRLCLEGQGTQ